MKKYVIALLAAPFLLSICKKNKPLFNIGTVAIKNIPQKIICLLFFGALCTSVYAQWSNTSNQFYDSLHMPVCTTAATQQRSIVVKSFPDSGYFVIWEDNRTNNFTGIYAQKYDKNGNRLWAVDGVPVATGTDLKSFSSLGNENLDYRNYGIACTDSAGGFYTGWMDNNVSGSGVTNKQRVCAQHVLGNGTAVFGQNGYIVREPLPGELFSCKNPQIIPDGKKGFFIGFLHEKHNFSGGTTGVDLYVYDFIDEGGTMVGKGGGKMDPDQEQGHYFGNCTPGSGAGILANTEEFIQEYFIYPNLQNGCNIVWIFSRNSVNRGPYIAFNSLCRVKKSCAVTVKRRFDHISIPATFNYNYVKDDLVKLYNQWTYHYSVFCTINGNLLLEPNEWIESGGEGYRLIDFNTCQPGTCDTSIFDYVNLRGAVIPTGSNINAGVITVNQRNYINNAITSTYTRGFYRQHDEVYDSLPYQLCTDTLGPLWAYNLNVPPGLKKVRYGVDTLLANGGNRYPYSLTTGGKRLFVTGTMQAVPFNTVYRSETRLQELKVTSVTSDSFTIKRQTDNAGGILLGRNAVTNYAPTDITYSNPGVTADKNGNAIFYVSESRHLRVSPIGDSAKLLWGAMGRPIGTVFNNNYPYGQQSGDGTGVITWTGNDNIYMRRLDSLDVRSHIPFKKLKSFKTLPFNTVPLIFTGASKAFSLLDANGFDVNNNVLTSSIIEILDNYDLGYTQAQVYDHNGPIRLYNGKPYLNRNYDIVPQNNPNGAATILLRLFFTQQQFDDLKTADPTIISPASLAVIKHPGNIITAAYAPVTGEVTILPTAWKAVDGGYYIEFPVTSFSNFFVFKNSNVVVPVTWVNVNAQWVNNTKTKVNWQVGNQVNVSSYIVQYSTNGTNFSNVCEVPAATNNSNYQCVVTATKPGNTNYYRILEKDQDGKSNYSKTVVLKPFTKVDVIKIFPNPATNIIHIESNEIISQVNIHDLAGRLLIHKFPDDKSSDINITILAKGIYTVRIKNILGTIKSEKLIIQ